MTLSVARPCDYIIEASLYFLLIFSPLAFGSVQILPLTILESTSFLILAVWLVKQAFNRGERPFVPNPVNGSLWLPILIFIFLILFQLLSLPKAILTVLSPKHLYIFENFLPFPAAEKIQYCLTVYQEPTLSKLFELLSYVSVFFVALNTFETKQQFKRLILVIILMGFLVSITGMARGFTYPFINKNHFAGYVEMTSFLAIGYLLTDLDQQKRIIFSFMSVVMILGLFLSLSRAGLLCFLFSLGLMFYLLRLRKTIRKKSLLILGLLMFTFLFMLIAGIEPFLERVSTLFQNEAINSEGRWLIWKDTLRIIRDFPVFGAGLGTFRSIYPMYKTITVQVAIGQAHSDFLQLIAETGFLGLGLTLAFLFIFFKKVFTIWLFRHHPFVKGVVLGGICAIFSLLLHSCFDFNLQIPSNALLLTFTIAITYKCIFIEDKNEAPKTIIDP